MCRAQKALTMMLVSYGLDVFELVDGEGENCKFENVCVIALAWPCLSRLASAAFSAFSVFSVFGEAAECSVRMENGLPAPEVRAPTYLVF